MNHKQASQLTEVGPPTRFPQTLRAAPMLDFFFRRGNPTNAWDRASDLSLSSALDAPSFNGVTLGARFDQLSSLGRNDRLQFGMLCYFDLGIGVAHAEDDTFAGYMIVLSDEDNLFQPYSGTLSWKHNPLDARRLARDDLPSVFGDGYWMDTDDNESLAFYEYPDYEMQIEMTLAGAIKRFILTNKPLMADPDQRASYQVDKPWPPQYDA